ncbi:MAG: response regulator [Pseudomonadota bacterium]|nr:response regulator [Pseudomonadota bacterium]
MREALPPLRVFVVENHEDTRFLLCLLLEQSGHVVESASSMREALVLLSRSEHDVLISDVGLPDGSGWELMKRLEAELPKRIYAIAMSGFGMASDRDTSRAAGFRHHLVKPVDPSDLERLLEEAAHERAAA